MERSEKPCAVLETKELRTNGRNTAETPRSLNPESRRSPRHVCVRQRDGGSALQRRSWSSSARESRAFLRGCDGSVEMCAWALKCAPHPLKKSAPYRQVFSVSQVGSGIQSRAHKDCVGTRLGWVTNRISRSKRCTKMNIKNGVDNRMRRKKFRMRCTKFARAQRHFFALSPSMVQPERDSKKYCE